MSWQADLANSAADVVSKVAQGKIRIVNTAKLLNKSRRTIERYLQRYQDVGIQFVIHRNTGRSPANKTPDSLKKRVQSLIKDKYYDVTLMTILKSMLLHAQKFASSDRADKRSST